MTELSALGHLVDMKWLWWQLMKIAVGPVVSTSELK